MSYPESQSLALSALGSIPIQSRNTGSNTPKAPQYFCVFRGFYDEIRKSDIEIKTYNDIIPQPTDQNYSKCFNVENDECCVGTYYLYSKAQARNDGPIYNGELLVVPYDGCSKFRLISDTDNPYTFDKIKSNTLVKVDQITKLRDDIKNELDKRRQSYFYQNLTTEQINKITNPPQFKLTEPALAETINALNDYLRLEFCYNINDNNSTPPATVKVKEGQLIKAEPINALYQNLSSVTNDCICYSNCNGYSWCQCYGYCNYY